MPVTRADPVLLRAYTDTTLRRVATARTVAADYGTALRRLHAAPTDLPVPVADRSGAVDADLADLALLDRRPALFAAALEAADDPGSSAALDAVRAAFDGLTDAELDAIADAMPWLVGSLDGVPPRVRYRANLHLVRAELDRVRALHAATGDPTLETRITSLEQLLEVRVDPVTMQQGHRQLLVFDPTGAGRVAEVFGDLDTAANVSVSVPGMTSKLDGYFEGFSGDVRELATEAALLDPSYAAIAWQGYDAPQGVGPVLAPDLAVDGAAVLDGFLAGLPPTGAGTTLIGHSYGSRVVGEAIVRHGLTPDAVVLLGSPGVGVDHVDDLGLPAGTPVYAARAPFDLVVTLGPHGADPTDPRFGASRLRTEHHQLGDGLIWWHSSYYAPDTHAVRNLALVAVGAHDRVTVVDPSIADRVVVAADDVLTALPELRRRLTDRAHTLADQPWLPPDVRASLRVAAGTATVAERVTSTVLGHGLTGFDLATDLFDDGSALAPQVRAAAERRLAELAEDTAELAGDVWDWGGDRVDDAWRWGGDRVDDLRERWPW
jgi:hypothetical protein